MSVKRVQTTTHVSFEVTGEDAVPLAPGSDDLIYPVWAKIEYVDGELTTISVYGRGLGSDMSPADLPDRMIVLTRDDIVTAPGWVRRMPLVVASGGRQ